MKKIIKVKDVEIGNGKVTIQTMLARKTVMVKENIEEICALKEAGCDIVRIAVSNDEDVIAFKEICSKSVLPVVADIQYDYRLALASIEAGASKIRINPSNIGTEEQVKLICDKAKEFGIPIRVGVNMGSLDPAMEKRYGRGFEALARSAIESAKTLERFDFHDIVISVKASDVWTMVQACKLIDKLSEYPQHIGVTEAGTRETGIVKNAIGIGSMLMSGIGDTIRVSLSASPLEEVYAAKRILKTLNLRKGVEVVSCPTCNRCNYDVYSLAKEIEEKTFNLDTPLKVAVMGCAVNGIGEGKDADVGIAGGKDNFVIFADGKILKTVSMDNYKEEFMKVINEKIIRKTQN
ncbi:MAG: flavodoxin-dependent (E)-4-hydroxy-3-methylbut-2-enyl-diphosphate synthase [Clostridia bacterium]